MSRGHAKSRTGRGAVGIVALLWLLLQGFTPQAGIGHVANARSEIRCSQSLSSDTAPAERDNSDFCCAAACARRSNVYIAPMRESCELSPVGVSDRTRRKTSFRRPMCERCRRAASRPFPTREPICSTSPPIWRSTPSARRRSARATPMTRRSDRRTPSRRRSRNPRSKAMSSFVSSARIWTTCRRRAERPSSSIGSKIWINRKPLGDWV